MTSSWAARRRARKSSQCIVRRCNCCCSWTSTKLCSYSHEAPRASNTVVDKKFPVADNRNPQCVHVYAFVSTSQNPVAMLTGTGCLQVFAKSALSISCWHSLIRAWHLRNLGFNEDDCVPAFYRFKAYSVVPAT